MNESIDCAGRAQGAVQWLPPATVSISSTTSVRNSFGRCRLWMTLPNARARWSFRYRSAPPAPLLTHSSRSPCNSIPKNSSALYSYAFSSSSFFLFSDHFHFTFSSIGFIFQYILSFSCPFTFSSRMIFISRFLPFTNNTGKEIIYDFFFSLFVNMYSLNRNT